MSKYSTQEFARMGAAARIKELQEEIDEIRRGFPGLDGPAPSARRPGRPPKAHVATAASVIAAPIKAPEPAAPVKRKRRKMSAAARKAIGDAQRKRWAKVKRQAK